MNPKEKAAELIEKFKKQFITVEGCNDGGNPCIVRTKMFHNSAKQCAIIAVDEILKAIDWHEFETPNKEFEYWQQVKNELTK